MSSLDCFDDRIYFCSLLSLLAIGLITALKKRSLDECLTTLFTNYTIVFLNQIKVQSKHLSDRIMTSIWLIMSIALVAAYSGVMYERLIRREPIASLKSLNELLDENSLWKNSKVYTFFGIGTFDELFMRALDNHDSIEKKLFNRSVEIDPLEMQFDHRILEKMFKNILENNYILSSNRLLIYNFLNIAKLKFPSLMSEYEEGVDYLVSDTDVTKPYFLPVFPTESGLGYIDYLNDM